MGPDIKTAAKAFCEALSGRLEANDDGIRARWFEAKTGPNYIRVVLHEEAPGVRSASPATFCFVVREDAPFGWMNYRAGDILAPMTSRRPWKMDTGAVGSVLAEEAGISYWVRRYGADLGLWPAECDVGDRG